MVLRYKPAKIDPLFADELKKIMLERQVNGLSKLDKSEASLREATRLMMKTESIKEVFKELRTKPKKY